LVVFVSAPPKPSFPGREFGVAGTPRERPEKLELQYVCMYMKKKKKQGIGYRTFFKAHSKITGFVNDKD
jgi:hypothetical protein